MVMKLNDELIARYVDGSATLDERNVVRRYLCEHPEEMEAIVALMDADTDDYLDEWEEAEVSGEMSGKELSSSEIALSVAAFAPRYASKRPEASECARVIQRNSGVLGRLSAMLKEMKEE